MNAYESFGLSRAINGMGVYTNLGGAIISPSVWAKMTAANEQVAAMPDLLDASGRWLAEQLGAEAARVVPGAAAGLALSGVACMVGDDEAAGERLPVTDGCRDRFVIQGVHRPAYRYLRVLSMTGGHAVDAGDADCTTVEQLADALESPRTAALVLPHYLSQMPNGVGLAESIDVAHAYGVPVILDAAFSCWPSDDLRKVATCGADLVCVSSKYYYGPNSGGYVTGRADLVRAIAAADFSGYEFARYRAFGRPFKLDRFSVLGTVAALEEWLEMDHAARWASYGAAVERLRAAIEPAAGLRLSGKCFTLAETVEDEPVNSLVVDVDAERFGATAEELATRLLAGTPAIHVHAWGNRLLVDVTVMQPHEVDVVAERLHDVIRPVVGSVGE